MPPRLKKILRRLLIFTVLIGVIGLIAFTWICYWPFEGRLENPAALIPPEVEFVFRGNYEDLKETGWVQRNIFADPIHPALGEQVESAWPEIRAQIEDLEAQINGNIPLGAVEFSLEDDVLSGDVLIAGKFCGNAAPPNPPTWRELLILKRIGWKPRTGLSAAIGNGWIRDMAIPAGQMKMTVDEFDVAKLVFPGVRVRTELERNCGEGTIVPPDNTWYMFRIKDTVALSNSPSLIQNVRRLSERSEDAADNFLSRPDFEIAPQEGRFVAAMDLEPLQWYLTRTLEEIGPQAQVLNRFLNIGALDKLNGSLSIENTDSLYGEATLDFRESQLSPDVQSMYRLTPTSFRGGIAELVPAEDTFLVATLKARPMHVFSALLSALTPDQRQLWEDNLKQMSDYDDVNAFLRDLSSRLGDTAALALGRLSDRFDNVEYTDWFSSEAEAQPSLAFMIRIDQNANLDEVNEFLSSKVPLLGFSEELEKKSYKGIEYTRLHLQQKIRDYELVTPCFVLFRDTFVLATNEDYFKKILETLDDQGRSMARDPDFGVAYQSLDSEGHLGLFVDLEKIFRVPRGLLWDMRNDWVRTHRDYRAAAIEYRQRQIRNFRAKWRRPPNEQQLDEIDEAVDAFVESYRRRYKEFIEERRQELRGWRRLGVLGLTAGSVDDQIHLKSTLLLRPGDASGEE